MLSHAAWFSQVMAIRGKGGCAEGEQCGTSWEMALSGELPHFFWSWSADRLDLAVAAKSSCSTFLLPGCFCTHIPSAGFFHSFLAHRHQSASQSEAEWTEARLLGLKSLPELQGFSQVGRAGWRPPRQPFSDSRSQRPKASHKPCLCDSYRLWGCTSNRVRLKCEGIPVPWTLSLGRACPLTKEITLRGDGGTLETGESPSSRGCQGGSCHPLSPLHTCPFYVGMLCSAALPPLTVPLTPTHLLGTGGSNLLRKADAVRQPLSGTTAA